MNYYFQSHKKRLFSLMEGEQVKNIQINLGENSFSKDQKKLLDASGSFHKFLKAGHGFWRQSVDLSAEEESSLEKSNQILLDAEEEKKSILSSAESEAKNQADLILEEARVKEREILSSVKDLEGQKKDLEGEVRKLQSELSKLKSKKS